MVPNLCFRGKEVIAMELMVSLMGPVLLCMELVPMSWSFCHRYVCESFEPNETLFIHAG